MGDDAKMTEAMPTITVGKLRNFLKKIENLKDEDTVTFEFVLTALFPTVFQNIQKYTNDCFRRGYAQGRRDEKNDNKGTN